MPEGGRPGTVECHLEGPAEVSILEDAHLLLEQVWAEVPDLDPGDRIRFEIAVVEILGNIVEHAFAADQAHPGRRLELTVTADADALVAEMGDNGEPVGLDLHDVSLPEIDDESGRGLAMAKASVDEISYDRVEGCNRWRLCCRRR